MFLHNGYQTAAEKCCVPEHRENLNDWYARKHVHGCKLRELTVHANFGCFYECLPHRGRFRNVVFWRLFLDTTRVRQGVGFPKPTIGVPFEGFSCQTERQFDRFLSLGQWTHGITTTFENFPIKRAQYHWKIPRYRTNDFGKSIEHKILFFRNVASR